MFKKIKEFIKRTPLIKVVDFYFRLKNKYVLKFVVPSSEQKRDIIKEYSDHGKFKYFIETGTFLGDTVQTFINDFEKIYSFELSIELADKAKARFKNDPHVQIINGDSGKELAPLLATINQPCLFWLDGHYSSEFFIGDEFIKTAKGVKETPIVEELKTILDHPLKDHVILIDDARCFTGNSDYPTQASLKEIILSHDPKAQVQIKNDIIRITFQNDKK